MVSDIAERADISIVGDVIEEPTQSRPYMTLGWLKLASDGEEANAFLGPRHNREVVGITSAIRSVPLQAGCVNRLILIESDGSISPCLSNCTMITLD